MAPHALTPADPTWNPCTEIRTVSPTLARVGDMKSLGPLGAAGGIQRDTEGGGGAKGHCRRANPVGCWFCKGGGMTNTISCQLGHGAERRETCGFFHPADGAGFIPPRREKAPNWVDGHYGRRIGEHRVECGGGPISHTRRANSLVSPWTAAPT